jgi:hypothetical protein
VNFSHIPKFEILGCDMATANDAVEHAKNAINLAMEDLVKADWKEVEKEIEEELAEIWKRKLACFQRTHNGVVKKLDMMATSSTKVNSHLNQEYLGHMVDVSVASKYGADLTQFTQVMAKDMRNTFDTLKQDLNASLPRQVRALVQQIKSEAQGKRVEAIVAVTIHSTVPNPNHGTLANVSQPNLGGNLNFQQPFYQTMAYGPGIPLMGNGTPHGPVLEVLFPRTPGPNMTPIRFGHNGGGG